MTPTALTPAARRAAAKRAATLDPPTSHPRRIRRPAAPSAPRRVSGPVSRPATAPRPKARSAAAGGGVVARPPQPRPAQPRRDPQPRRKPQTRRNPRSRRPSGLSAATATVRGLAPAIGRALPHARRQSGPLGARLAAGVRTMPEHRLIDRLVRGRAWIPVLGVMLAGIVFMQVETLKLGAGIGRAVQQASVLGAQNQQLRASVATLGDDQRIESLAAQMGMIMPAPTAVGFLSTPTSAAKALRAMVAPSDTQFLNASSSNGTIALNNDLAQTGSSHAGAITIAPAPGTTGSSTSPTLPSASAPSSSGSTATSSTPSSSTPTGTASAPAIGTSTGAPTTPTQTTSTPSSTQTGGAQLAPTTTSQSTGP